MSPESAVKEHLHLKVQILIIFNTFYLSATKLIVFVKRWIT